MNKIVKGRKKLNLSLKNISKVKMDKDDVIIIHIDANVPRSTVNELKDYVQPFFPNNEILILAKPCKLDIISKEELEEK